MTSEDFAALKRKHEELEEAERNGTLFTQSKSTASEVIVLISSDDEEEHEENGAKVEVESEQRKSTERFITIVKAQPKETISESESEEEEDEEVDIQYTSNTEAEAEEEEEDFTKEESKALRRRAKEMGAVPFLQEQLRSGTPPLLLFKAFNFPLPESSLISAADESELLWSVLYRYLKRFCLIRERLPHLHSLDHAVELMQRSKNIIVLTGAGISVSCGIPDFRSEGTGLYARIAEKYPDLDDPQLLFDIDYFLHSNHLPFYELAREIYPTNFQPSDTHHFIKLLESRGQLLRNYTQNIDTLEKSAGISRVVHCHGSFQTATCLRCRRTVDGKSIEAKILLQQVPYCEHCDCSNENDLLPPALMKPDIVFFGESLPKVFDECVAKDREQVDLLIVIGSSLNVAPVSELIGYFPHSVPIVLINREPVYHYHTRFDIQLLGYCDGIVQYLQQKLEWSETKEEESIEIESVEPNVHLFPGHKFNIDRHTVIMQRVEDSDDNEEEEDYSTD